MTNPDFTETAHPFHKHEHCEPVNSMVATNPKVGPYSYTKLNWQGLFDYFKLKRFVLVAPALLPSEPPQTNPCKIDKTDWQAICPKASEGPYCMK